MNVAEIDCHILDENIEAIAEWLPRGCKLAAVVKGDAYGHGLRGMAHVLGHNPKVHMLVVASLEEALIAIECQTAKPVLVLNRHFANEVEVILSEACEEQKHRIADRIIFSAYRVEDVEEYAALGERMQVRFSMHLRLDFSVGLKGVDRQQYREHRELLLREDRVHICGIYAHLYSAYGADPDSGKADIEEYLTEFERIPCNRKKGLTLHLLSSVSAYRYPEATLDMVRIGVSVYGLPVRGKAPLVRPILSIFATVVSCVEAQGPARTDYFGELPEEVNRVALLSIGSWDIPRMLAPVADAKGNQVEKYVKIGSHLCRLVGMSCMDTCCADITGLDDIREGDTVTVLGEEEGVRLEDWLERSALSPEDCQMLFEGMSRLKKQYIER